LDGLVLGALRVIDRLRVAPREAVYRVFDPRRGQEAGLRHLAEAELAEPGHLDDFRRPFTPTAAVRRPARAATRGVLALAARPGRRPCCRNGLPVFRARTGRPWPRCRGSGFACSARRPWACTRPTRRGWSTATSGRGCSC